MFTSIKDLNLKILSELPDKDLINVITTNKCAYNICNNENFWRDRVVDRYNKVLKYKNQNMSWKDYYMQIVKDLKKYRENPLYFLNYIICFPNNPDRNIYIHEDWIQTNLQLAASYMINNFHYLNLGKNLIIWLEDKMEHGRLVYERKIFSDLTPENLLKLGRIVDFEGEKNDCCIQGFASYGDIEGYDVNNDNNVEGYVALTYNYLSFNQ